MPEDNAYRRFTQEASQRRLQQHRECKAIIFDVEYTLANHESAVRAGIQAARQEIPGLRKTTNHELVVAYSDVTANLRARGGYWGSHEGCPELHNQLLIPFFAKADMLAPGPDVRARFRKVYARAYRQAWRARGECAQVLRKLRRQGYKIGAFHNGRTEDQVAMIEKIGLWGAFDLIISGQEIHTAKPDARVFEVMAREMGVNIGETIVVGACLESDVYAGLRAGVGGAVLYQASGFRIPELVPEFELAGTHWVPVVNDLEHILDLFNIRRSDRLAVKMTDSDTLEQPPSPPQTPAHDDHFHRLAVNEEEQQVLHQRPAPGQTSALGTATVQAQAPAPGWPTTGHSSIATGSMGLSSRPERARPSSGRAPDSPTKADGQMHTTSGDSEGAIEYGYELVSRGTMTMDTSPSPPSRETTSSQWDVEMVDLPVSEPARRRGISGRRNTEGVDNSSRPSNVGSSTAWDRLRRSVGLGSSAENPIQIEDDDDDDDCVMVE